MKFKGSIESQIPKLSIIISLLISLLLIPASNNFQEMVKELSWASTFTKYFYYVLQYFVVVISYYAYYFINHKILFNGVFKKKGILFYILGLVLLVVLLPPIQNLILLMFPVIADLKIHVLAINQNVFATINYSFAVFVLIWTFPLILIIEWYNQESRFNVLEKEKAQVELDLLKQQINPHFFFNTLNNLYAMSLTKDERTPETILKLSELMRFVIYKGKEEKVKLSHEVKYIQDYLDLQLIRFKKNIDLKFEQNIENEQVEIAPLLFIILIENAFKHGIEPAENDGFIHISIDQKGDELKFSCKNSFEQKEEENNSGIGIENLKSRLNLIYPNEHKLQINKDKMSFTAKLNLKL